ncbi:MAG: RsmE family RNA methyltransferase [Anaerotardibacter sp.]
MSLPRFFLTNQVLATISSSTFILELESEDVKHARVLRLQPKEHIAVIDASLDYFECEIVSFDDEGMRVSIAKHTSYTAPYYSVTLVQGLPKGDKFDLILRHATELGVSAFIPFECERSVVKLDAKKAEKRRQRWESIVKSAAMQSGSASIPTIEKLSKISQVLFLLESYDAVLVLWEEAPETCYIEQALCDVLSKIKDERPQTPYQIAVVVGPEGGLSQTEVDTFTQNLSSVSLVSLGSTILRTETAGIVGPALVLYELGALGNMPLA